MKSSCADTGPGDRGHTFPAGVFSLVAIGMKLRALPWLGKLPTAELHQLSYTSTVQCLNGAKGQGVMRTRLETSTRGWSTEDTKRLGNN